MTRNPCVVMTALFASACFVHQALADYPATVLGDNPVAYYRFEEAEGSEETSDSSGNGHDSLEVNQAEFGVDGVCESQGVEFFGDGSIVVDLNIDPTDPEGDGDGTGHDDFTIETWMYTTSERDQQVYIAQKDGNGLGRSDVLITSGLELGSFIGGATTNSGVMPELETWYHFVMAIDGGDDELYFYVDGEPSELNPQFAGANGVEPADGEWVIGSHKGQAIQFFEGILDEIAFYDYRLDDPNGDNDTSDSRVAAHFDACSAVGVPGDFNADGLLTAIDIDRLSLAIRDGEMDTQFDVNGDGRVTNDDHEWWVEELKVTYFGDANLDGEFGSADLVTVFAAGTYDTDQPAGWAAGDWNADGLFTSGDLVRAFAGGGYEVGPRPDDPLVPEPTSASLAFLALIGTLLIARR